MSHRFGPEHMERLLSPERHRLLPPETVLTELSVGLLTSVADVGVGPGYFAIPAAHKTKGIVYGIDVEPKMLAALQQRAKEEGLTNVETLEGAAETIPLPDRAVDRALCAFVLHEVPDLDKALRELRRITKTDGLLCMVEWEKQETSFGPPVADRLAKHDLKTALERLGMTVVKERKPNDAHYLLVCENR